MTLIKLLPLIVAMLYLTTGILHLRKGEYASFGLWASYALGNVFIIQLANKE
jgi:hypothetical protein